MDPDDGTNDDNVAFNNPVISRNADDLVGTKSGICLANLVIKASFPDHADELTVGVPGYTDSVKGGIA